MRLPVTLLLISSLFVLGCAPQGIYYFGRYSQTLYTLEKEPSAATLLSHQQALETIIAESQERQLRVPPGIYAELGYLHLKAKRPKQAIPLFQSEAQLYPESQTLMNKLVNHAQ